MSRSAQTNKEARLWEMYKGLACGPAGDRLFETTARAIAHIRASGKKEEPEVVAGLCGEQLLKLATVLVQKFDDRSNE